MATAEELQAIIDANAAGPRDASVDGRSASTHSIKDQLELLKYKSEQAAAASPAIGLRPFHTIPPGAV